MISDVEVRSAGAKDLGDVGRPALLVAFTRARDHLAGNAKIPPSGGIVWRRISLNPTSNDATSPYSSPSLTPVNVHFASFSAGTRRMPPPMSPSTSIVSRLTASTAFRAAT